MRAPNKITTHTHENHPIHYHPVARVLRFYRYDHDIT